MEIKRNDFIKYLKCTYLVKDFVKLDNGYYNLSYYFRVNRKSNSKLHFNGVYRISGYSAEKIKKTSIEETYFLVSRIKAEHPNFDLSFLNSELNQNESILNEKDCIEYLKGKGYLVFKQI